MRAPSPSTCAASGTGPSCFSALPACAAARSLGPIAFPEETEDGGGFIEILADGALLPIDGKTGWRLVEIGR